MGGTTFGVKGQDMSPPYRHGQSITRTRPRTVYYLCHEGRVPL